MEYNGNVYRGFMLVEITELVIVIIDYVQLRVRTRAINISCITQEELESIIITIMKFEVIYYEKNI